MTWPLFLGIFAGVVVTNLCCERIKKNAKKPNFIKSEDLKIKYVEKVELPKEDKIKE